MSVRSITTQQRPIAALLNEVKVAAVRKLFARLQEQGFEHIREGHGCVFGFIDIEHGSRLTELAERVPDPTDRRAKIIKLTPSGVEACLTGRRIFAEIEREWAEELGEDLVAGMREAAERIAASEREPTAGRPRTAA